MKKTETAAQRELKIKELSRRISDICSKFYESATDEQKQTILKMVDDLENAMIAYRKYEVPWDSQLIDVPHKVNGQRKRKGETKWQEGVSYKTKAFSTFESVMDKALELFAFVAPSN